MPAHASKCIHPSLDRIFRSPSLRLANSCLPQRTLSLPAAGCEFTRSRATKLVPYSGSSSCTTHGLLLVGGLQSSHRPAGNSHSDACGKSRLLTVRCYPLADTRGNKRCGTGGRLGQDDSKLIATISRGRVNRPAKQTEHSANAAQCPAAYQVAVAVIDILQPIQVQQQNSKRPSRAPRSFHLRTEDV